jgi:hypothetical protein
MHNDVRAGCYGDHKMTSFYNSTVKRCEIQTAFTNLHVLKADRIAFQVARKISSCNRAFILIHLLFSFYDLQKNLKEDFKSVRTLAIVSGTFLVCCIPFTIVAFIYGDNKVSMEFQRNAAFTGILMSINAISDPVIYYFRSSEFRAFYQRFKRSWQAARGNSLEPIRPSRTLAWAYKMKRQIAPAEDN